MNMPNGFHSMQGAADFLGPGAIEINMYEEAIFDIVRRTSIALQRFKHPQATGQPHRYFEQTAIAQATYTDPRNLVPVVSNPTRVERSVTIKALINQTNISLFDKEVTQQQNQFAYIVAQDIADIANGVEVLSANGIWIGNDTSLVTPTTNQYFGLLSQITQTSVIVNGASIIDGLKAEVATMFGNVTYVVKPTCLYMSPQLANYLDQEAKANQVTFGSAEVIGGVKVKTLSTQAGELPIIADPYIPATTDGSFGFTPPPAGQKNYFCAILTESLIEMPVISGDVPNQNPRLFQLGLTGNLSGQFVAVKFDAIFAKGPNYAHSIVAVQRP